MISLPLADVHGSFQRAAARMPEASVPATGFYPNIVTARFHETWDFYTTHLGFRTETAWDTYVHLVHPNGAQLGVMKDETSAHLPELVGATQGRGWWLRLDVDDVTAVRDALVAAGCEVTLHASIHPACARTYLVRDPNGVWIGLGQLPAS